MKSYVSIIKYYPDNTRDEGFGVGLVVVDSSGKNSKIRFSEDRIKRINSAFGLKKSKLLDLSIKEYSEQQFNKEGLFYLSSYTNGSLRFCKPEQFVTEDLARKFEDLYTKYVSDYSELENLRETVNTRSNPVRIGQKLRSNFLKNPKLEKRLNIGYDFKDDKVNQFLIGNSFIDFIGGNGTVFCGEVINLEVGEESLQRNFYKIITLFEALEKVYLPLNRFDPTECKLLVLKDQADKKDNAHYMERINTWHKKANYSLLIKNRIEDFEDEVTRLVDSKGIIRFKDWSTKLEEKLIK